MWTTFLLLPQVVRISIGQSLKLIMREFQMIKFWMNAQTNRIEKRKRRLLTRRLSTTTVSNRWDTRWTLKGNLMAWALSIKGMKKMKFKLNLYFKYVNLLKNIKVMSLFYSQLRFLCVWLLRSYGKSCFRFVHWNAEFLLAPKYKISENCSTHIFETTPPTFKYQKF